MLLIQELLIHVSIRLQAHLVDKKSVKEFFALKRFIGLQPNAR